MGSAMVPLDRALLHKGSLSKQGTKLFGIAANISATVWAQFATQILTEGFDPNPIPKSPLRMGRPRPLSNIM